ncbi:hypothetical protein [Pseudonocardia parietis]|uniref:Uncharacterized protein n=1 Tax=Pseudonocardia parietis TaxID=570936 RepID=A0ABS4W6G9_9PSEU|nr:hypothetical protein [Pseudonocardia parietis]MBP2371229.1 hypothetical protein [Pseudonocardia parietis]
MSTVIDIVSGPAGAIPVLAVIGLLVIQEFAREQRPVTVPRSRSPGSVLTIWAALVAFGILALRFYGFS